MKGLSFLFELRCIFLASNSLPDPDGPIIKALLSVKAILFIEFLIFFMEGLLPTNS